jgi:hypothetical protein
MNTYIINLASRPDRLVEALKEADDNFFKTTVVRAVEATEAPTNLNVSAGVWACWQSHKKCYELLLNSQDDYALIFEDDFQIKNKNNFERDLSLGIQMEADLVQLGYLRPGLLRKFIDFYFKLESLTFRFLYVAGQLNFLKKFSLDGRLRPRIYSQTPTFLLPDIFFPGAHAYLISRNLALEVMTFNNPQFLSADDFFSSLANMRTFRIYRSRKSSVSQRKSATSISKRFLREENAE